MSLLISNELFKIDSLSHINLRGNKLFFIQPEIRGLSRLEYLNLENNESRDLPVEVSLLKNLKS